MRFSVVAHFALSSPIFDEDGENRATDFAVTLGINAQGFPDAVTKALSHLRVTAQPYEISDPAATLVGVDTVALEDDEWPRDLCIDGGDMHRIGIVFESGRVFYDRDSPE